MVLINSGLRLTEVYILYSILLDNIIFTRSSEQFISFAVDLRGIKKTPTFNNLGEFMLNHLWNYEGYIHRGRCPHPGTSIE